MDVTVVRAPVERPQVPARRSSARSAHRYSRAVNKWQDSSSAVEQAPSERTFRADHSVRRSSSIVRPSSAPQTRSFSPLPPPQMNLSFQTPIPNFSRPRIYIYEKTDPPDAMNGKRSLGSAAVLKNARSGAQIRRWDGATRSHSDWDGLRRDSELWYPDGDCLVHLYAKGHSRRGPSFRVPFAALQQAQCGSLFSLCFAQLTPDLSGHSPVDSPDDGFFGSPTPSKCELFVPAPEDSMRESAFMWHITTRNFFAFVFGKPLVGTHLGQTLVEVRERMNFFRSGEVNNNDDFMSYLEHMGYLEFGHCPDYALALLYYAEHYELQDLWIDAFAHCVGMNDCLSMSAEFGPISRVTKALITRAYLEMDLHLGRVARALSYFLEDDFSAAYLGLSEGARAHLDRFRSFLHSFYVEKFGYWPPPKGSQFSKALYRSMYFDFRNLYDYLVDNDSSDSLSKQKPASGGICVLQNVQALDKRHKYTPLPHPLPLVPEPDGAPHRTQSQRALLSFKLGTKQAKTDRFLTTRAALSRATNQRDVSVTSSPLVRAYCRFEHEWSSRQEEKVSIADARKVRWILIYGVLQMLISVTRAPKEVRDTDGPSYPLCCLVAGTPPWKIGAKALVTPAVPSNNIPGEGPPGKVANAPLPSPPPSEKPLPVTPPLSIHPDCETDDYFSHSRTHSSNTPQRYPSVQVPSPLRIQDKETSSPVARNTSIRSIRALSFSGFSSRRNSIVIKPQPQAFCEILVHGYGNGLNETVVGSPTKALQILEESQPEEPEKEPDPSSVSEAAATVISHETQKHHVTKRRPASLEIQCAPILEIAKERSPLMESFQLDGLHDTEAAPASEAARPKSPADTNDTGSGLMTPIWSSSSRGSSASLSSIGDLPAMDHTSVGSDSNRGSADATPISPISGHKGQATMWLADSPIKKGTEEQTQAQGRKQKKTVRIEVPPILAALENYPFGQAEVDIHSALTMLPERVDETTLAAAQHKKDVGSVNAPASSVEDFGAPKQDGKLDIMADSLKKADRKESDHRGSKARKRNSLRVKSEIDVFTA